MGRGTPCNAVEGEVAVPSPSTGFQPTAATQPVPALGSPPDCRPAYTPLPIWRWGGKQVPEAFIRFSVGCEDPDDLIADVERALDLSAG